MSFRDGGTADQVCRWHPVTDAAALAADAASRILSASRRAIDARGQFHMVLAGGNTPTDAYRLLRGADTDWRAWHAYFGDERCAPADDPARNSRMADAAWLDHVAVPRDQRHAIPAELGAIEGARRYAATLAPLAMFDLVLLGLGEDGHTASLFPGHPLSERPADAPVVAVYDAPKPPPERISLGAWRLGQAREVLFLVAGDDKRDAVAQWRAGAPIPARAVRPAAGVDVLAVASLLGTAA